MIKTHIEIQKLTKEKNGRPHKTEIKKWFAFMLETLKGNNDWQAYMPTIEPVELTLRIVEENESAQLNSHTRNINKPTNVLSFPFESPNTEMAYYLGDIAMCGPVIYREAAQQHRDVKAHWAHLFIHGCLHLLGFDHDTDEHAEVMEAVEQTVLDKLGYPSIH